MLYNLNDKEYKVEIIRKSNKNTYIRIKDDLTIQVTTNYFINQKAIIDLLDRNNTFLEKTIEKKQNDIDKKDYFYYLGKKYDIIELSSIDSIDIVNDKIYVSEYAKLDRWVKKEMQRIFDERLKYNFSLFEESIPYPTLKIRNMKTRWGVCNRKNLTVTLNSNLIKESIDKIDYVIIHELSHLVHFNHSKSFWTIVEKYCPKYKKIRKDLRE